jgi:hypothetical protein
MSRTQTGRLRSRLLTYAHIASEKAVKKVPTVGPNSWSSLLEETPHICLLVIGQNPNLDYKNLPSIRFEFMKTARAVFLRRSQERITLAELDLQGNTLDFINDPYTHTFKPHNDENNIDISNIFPLHSHWRVQRQLKETFDKLRHNTVVPGEDPDIPYLAIINANGDILAKQQILDFTEFVRVFAKMFDQELPEHYRVLGRMPKYKIMEFIEQSGIPIRPVTSIIDDMIVEGGYDRYPHLNAAAL